MKHVSGAPFPPQIQGKKERWHQITKNRVLLVNYNLPEDLEHQIKARVGYSYTQRDDERLNSVTPADGYLRRKKVIMRQGDKIKKLTLWQYRLKQQNQSH